MNEPTSADDGILAARVRVPDHVVYRNFPDETVVLNLESGIYHGLNGTAARMLELVQERDSVAAAVDELAREFEQPREVIERDVVGLCRALAERGLIERDERTGD
jgi:Coenzyme PQQ synthesis protein D (PqqD)